MDPTSLVLNKFGSRRNCKTLPPVLLFKDIEDKLFKLTRKGRWIKAISKGQMINSSSEFPRYHVYNKLLAHGNKPKIPRIKLMDALQESMDVVDSISQMSEDERDAMKSVLSNREGVINLEKNSNKGKEILKNAGLSLKGEIWKVFRPILIYLSPFVIICVLGWICFGLKRKKNRNHPVVDSIIIRKRERKDQIEESMI